MIKNYTMKNIWHLSIFQNILQFRPRNQKSTPRYLGIFRFHEWLPWSPLWWEVFLREAEKKPEKQKQSKNTIARGGLHPWRLTWNIIMEVWKIIFLRKWVICRFHVYLPGCKIWSKTIDCWCLAAWNMSGCMVCRVDSHGLFLWPFHFGVR